MKNKLNKRSKRERINSLTQMLDIVYRMFAGICKMVIAILAVTYWYEKAGTNPSFNQAQWTFMIMVFIWAVYPSIKQVLLELAKEKEE